MAPAPWAARQAPRWHTRTLWTWGRTSQHDAPQPPTRHVKHPRPSPGSRLYELMHHPELLEKPLAPRLPIVLCHGLYGFDVRGPFLGLEYQYWSATLDILRKKVGATVLVHGVPPTGSIKERAESLHRFLCENEEAKGQRLNFVGHSMGGLDARYLFSHIKPTEYTPASLTTLSTPHRGSPFMDWCNSNIGVGLELIESMMDKVQPKTVPDDDPVPRAPYSLKAPLFSRDKEALSTSSSRNALSALSRALRSVSNSVSHYMLSVLDQPAYAMLSTRYMTRLFNPTTPDQPGIQYYSVAARATEISVLHPLWLPKLILDKAAATGSCGADTDGSGAAVGTAESGNDGLVSVRSAQWGQFLGIMEDWDHWDIRGPGGPHRLRVAEAASHLWSPSRLWSTLRDKWRKLGSPPASSAQESWNWRDAALSEYDERSQADPSETPLPPAVHALLSIYEKQVDAIKSSDMAERLAQWISSHLPSKDAAHEDTSHTEMLLQYLTADRASEESWLDSQSEGRTGRNAGSERDTSPALSRMARLSTALIECFPYALHVGHEALTPTKDDTFVRFWAAVCRHLHEEGL